MVQFRRNGRDERRRRVLMDDLGDREDGQQHPRSTPPAETQRTDTPRRNYTEAAQAEQPRRVIDLIPLRGWTQGVLVLLALTAIAGLEAAYGRVFILEGRGHGLEILDPSARGSLASWFCSLLAMLAGAAALLVYTLRRHRADDYRGRYRLWLWAAGFSILLSIEAVTQVHSVIAGISTRLAGTPLFSDGSIWWIVVYATAWLILWARLGPETWSCRRAFASLVLTSACFLASATLSLELVLADSPALAVMIQSSLAMVGYLTLLYSFTAYARYVLLDAQGRIEKKPLRKRNPRDSSAQDQQRRRSADNAAEQTAATERTSTPRTGRSQTDLEPAASGPQARQAAEARFERLPESRQAGRPRHSGSEQPAEEEPDGDKKPSKAERRRLRKMKRRAVP